MSRRDECPGCGRPTVRRMVGGEMRDCCDTEDCPVVYRERVTLGPPPPVREKRPTPLFDQGRRR